jgi:hypothetical protein
MVEADHPSLKNRALVRDPLVGHIALHDRCLASDEGIASLESLATFNPNTPRLARSSTACNVA